MSIVGKSFALILIFIMAISSSSLLVVKPVNAQSTPTPTVPTFTFKFVDSYLMHEPPAHDYYVQNVTLAIIKNNGASYYNFRYKWYDTSKWSYYPFNPNDTNGYNDYGDFSVPNPASASNYTEIIMNNFLHTSSSYVGYLIDFQIQGLFGSYNATPSNNQIFPDLGTTYDFVFNGTVSDWSSTQTLTYDGTNFIPSSYISPTLTPTSTPTPTVPEFPLLVILPLFAIVLLMAFKFKYKKSSPPTFYLS